MIISTENNFSLTISVGGDGSSNTSNSFAVNSGDNASSNNNVSNMKVDLSLNEMEFDSSMVHWPAVAAGLAAMRERGQLTDVVLRTEDQTFPAHRVILAACSDYFRAMFTTLDPASFRERGQPEVTLAGVTASGVKHLLDYAYTARLSLSLANVEDVLASASHLQVTRVVEACSNYLQSQLDVDNCVDVLTLAENYFLKDLTRRARRFISENLSQFCSVHPELLESLSANQLEGILESDFPVDVAEDAVLEMLLNWLQFSREDRMAHAHKLLKNVNFDEIHPAHLRSLVQKKISSNLPRSFLSRIETLSDKSASPSSSITAHLVNSRGMEEALVKVGGFSPHGVTNQITYFLPSQNRWQLLTSVPHVETCNFGCAVVRNELFVIGGCFNQSLQEEHIHPFGFRYDSRTNKWRTTSPMLRERCRFSLTALGGALFAFGGCAENQGGGQQGGGEGDWGGGAGEGGPEEPTRTLAEAERYDCDSDRWTPLCALPLGPRTQHASVRIHQKNAILISGGLDEQEEVLDSMVLYWPSKDEYEPVFHDGDGGGAARRRLPEPRADHAMLAWRDKILVCGGWCEDDVGGRRRLLDRVEVYDAESNQWTTETTIPTPRYHAGIAVVGDRLFVAGGLLDKDSLMDRATGLIECYDLLNRRWIQGDGDDNALLRGYPEESWEHACASLFVPRCREDIHLVERKGNNM